MTSERLVAYVGEIIGPTPNNYVTSFGKLFIAARRALTDWRGNQIGYCYLASSWPIRSSYIGSRMYQIYATVDGVQYTGRGFGQSMAAMLKPCAKQHGIV